MATSMPRYVIGIRSSDRQPPAPRSGDALGELGASKEITHLQVERRRAVEQSLLDRRDERVPRMFSLLREHPTIPGTNPTCSRRVLFTAK